MSIFAERSNAGTSPPVPHTWTRPVGTIAAFAPGFGALFAALAGAGRFLELDSVADSGTLGPTRRATTRTGPRPNAQPAPSSHQP